MKRIREYGVKIGHLETGNLNSITDVEGVKVGHVTLDNKEIKTGVTVVLPAEDNLFLNKMTAACHVINGFGKSVGLVQVEELGTLETPIVLTNTLSVADALRGLIEYKISRNADIGTTTGTVNGVVCECNDAYLNDIRGFHVKPEHVLQAIQNASEVVEEGAAGAGKGMAAFGLKGGIGTSSRVVKLESEEYTLGVLLLTNMGKMKHFRLDGKHMGEELIKMEAQWTDMPDKGSIIMIVATDAPVNQNQLKRIIKRTIVGLSRTGSGMGHGSGEIVVGFTTAVRHKHYKNSERQDIKNTQGIHDDDIDRFFEAVADATEEAVYNAMTAAQTTCGREGHMRRALADYNIASLLTD